jgi:hypothetical protein
VENQQSEPSEPNHSTLIGLITTAAYLGLCGLLFAMR